MFIDLKKFNKQQSWTSIAWFHTARWPGTIRFLWTFSSNQNFKMAAKDGKTVRAGWHWSCASKYCKNSWKTPNVEYYTLTKAGSAPKTAQDAYLEVLGKLKEDLNFEKDFCSNALFLWLKTELRRLPKHQVYRVKKPRVSKSLARALTLCCYALCTNYWHTKHKDLNRMCIQSAGKYCKHVGCFTPSVWKMQ